MAKHTETQQTPTTGTANNASNAPVAKAPAAKAPTAKAPAGKAPERVSRRLAREAPVDPLAGYDSDDPFYIRHKIDLIPDVEKIRRKRERKAKKAEKKKTSQFGNYISDISDADTSSSGRNSDEEKEQDQIPPEQEEPPGTKDHGSGKRKRSPDDDQSTAPKKKSKRELQEERARKKSRHNSTPHGDDLDNNDGRDSTGDARGGVADQRGATEPVNDGAAAGAPAVTEDPDDDGSSNIDLATQPPGQVRSSRAGKSNEGQGGGAPVKAATRKQGSRNAKKQPGGPTIKGGRIDKTRKTDKAPKENTRPRRRKNAAPGGGGDPEEPDPIVVANPRQIGVPRNQDEKFLFDAIGQFSAERPRNGSLRREHLTTVLPLLHRVEQPIEDRIQRFHNIPAEERGDQPDCYILNAAEAKLLMESIAEIEAPVFVPDGGRQGLFTGDSRRPIEQFLRSWLVVGAEQIEGKRSGTDVPGTRVSAVATLRAHFLRQEAERTYPWNLPDIRNPRPGECRPFFLETLNCNLLQDIVRRVQDPDADEVCPEHCPQAYAARLGCSNERHILTRAEFFKSHEAWQSWQGTVMLADPGAITEAHMDNFGLGTWISCQEGEIGVAWRSHPSVDEWRDHRRGRHSIQGRSLYKVLRRGEVLYMPPGTIHTVFRRPQGNHTLGFAGHVLRRSAVLQWLWVLNEEVTFANSKTGIDFVGHDHEHIVPPIAEALLAMLDGPHGNANFGGEDRVDRIVEAAEALRAQGATLRRKAKAAADARAAAAEEHDPNGEDGPTISPITPQDDQDQ